MFGRLAGRLVTGPVAFALGGFVEAGRYWRSRLFGAERRRLDAEKLARRDAETRARRESQASP